MHKNQLNNKNILITGAAGFIGMHLVKALSKNNNIVGIDNLNDYYDQKLKIDRLFNLGIKFIDNNQKQFFKSLTNERVEFYRVDICNIENVEQIFKYKKFDIVINLAAQAGVRYSIDKPELYIQNNIVGFHNIISIANKYKVQKFIYASSSSVYGNSENDSFNETDQVDNPVSIYAATKKSNELIAHAYSSIYNLKTIGLRFFTVYGPWGRPDMAYHHFTKDIIEQKPIKIFNQGNLKRDFTYIDDIISGIKIISQENIEPNYSIFNIGNNKPIKLIDFIGSLEKVIGKKAVKEMVEMQKGDVLATAANTEKLRNLGYNPQTDLNKGLTLFFDWYKKYYLIKSK